MSRKQESNRASIRERIANAVDISKDIILDTALLRLTGNIELIIENYKGILEYSDSKILIKAKPMSIKICGSSLEIGTITEEMLFISGSISDISFVNE